MDSAAGCDSTASDSDRPGRRSEASSRPTGPSKEGTPLSRLYKTKTGGKGQRALPPVFLNRTKGNLTMSAERMIENAMQKQPILLLPFFMLFYYVTRIAKPAAESLASSSSQHRLTRWV